MIHRGDGWEVEWRTARELVLGEKEPRLSQWLPVEFFVFVPSAGSIVVVALVLDNGRLEPTSGKLRKTV